MDFLIIDDDKTFRDATCFLIEDAGHYAEGAESGQLGLATGSRRTNLTPSCWM